MPANNPKATRSMRTWLAIVLLALVALLLYVATGPYRTVRAIRHAIQAQDAAALADEVDFPALRASLKAQLDDRLVRKAGSDLQSSFFGAMGIRIAQGLGGAAVDTMVTPLGLGALMEGRREWSYAASSFRQDPPPTADGTDAGDGEAERPDPLRDITYRYASPSRFTATVRDARGRPTVLVMTRSGLHWKLSDIRLPPP
jgi:hypothetical protein